MQNYTAPKPIVYSLFSELNEETNILIGGSTGSGKSVLEDGMIYNLAAEFTPQDVEIYLIDPKMVQLRKWAVLPHVKGYASTTTDAGVMLDEIKEKMMRRYMEMTRDGLEQYTGKAIYVFIDELADLIIEDAQIVRKLQKILQLCRAANIHIVCCSQSVSRMTVPAALQINFTARVGLRTVSAIDSRQIIKTSGCENLPRHGECILNTAEGLSKRKVPMYSAEHIRAMREYWMRQRVQVGR